MPARTVFHLAAAATYGYGIYYDLYKLKLPTTISIGVQHVAFGGRWKYLTFWDLNVQFIFFLLSFIYDAWGLFATNGGRGNNNHSNNRKRGGGGGGQASATTDCHQSCSKKLKAVVDYIFAVLAFPMGTLVFALFWGLWVYDRELIFPRDLDPFFPMWLNHIMHTIIFPLILIDMYWVHHVYPTKKNGFTGIAAFVIAYASWIFIIAYASGFWVYPILQVLNWWQRTIFIVICVLSAFVIYLVGEFVNDLTWGKSSQPRKDKSKKKRGKAS